MVESTIGESVVVSPNGILDEDRHDASLPRRIPSRSLAAEVTTVDARLSGSSSENTTRHDGSLMRRKVSRKNGSEGTAPRSVFVSPNGVLDEDSSARHDGSLMRRKLSRGPASEASYPKSRGHQMRNIKIGSASASAAVAARQPVTTAAPIAATTVAIGVENGAVTTAAPDAGEPATSAAACVSSEWGVSSACVDRGTGGTDGVCCPTTDIDNGGATCVPEWKSDWGRCVCGTYSPLPGPLCVLGATTPSPITEAAGSKSDTENLTINPIIVIGVCVLLAVLAVAAAYIVSRNLSQSRDSGNARGELQAVSGGTPYSQAVSGGTPYQVNVGSADGPEDSTTHTRPRLKSNTLNPRDISADDLSINRSTKKANTLNPTDPRYVVTKKNTDTTAASPRGRQADRDDDRPVVGRSSSVGSEPRSSRSRSEVSQ
jgi:hypothetical protein